MHDATVHANILIGAECEKAGPSLPLRSLLAWRNLTHDRIRFVVTIIGIVFAVTLMAVQMGLLTGCLRTIALVIEVTDAEIWMAARGARSVDLPGYMQERRRFQALSVEAVQSADPYIHLYAILKRPDGGSESVIVVGFDFATQRGAPPNLIEGSVKDLAIPDGIIVDRLYKEKLGIERIGQVLEINSKRTRVVGFTDGVRTFSQSPHVFADIKTARHILNLAEGELNYVLIKLAPGADPAQVREALAKRMPEVDVHLKAEFARQSYMYWLITTGAGLSLVIAAALGLLVGIIVTAQTLYAATMDRLQEYATLRAMGAPKGYLYGIILQQAAIAATIGCVLGLGLAGAVIWSTQNSSVAMMMPLELAVSLIFTTFVMCAGSAVISIHKVMSLDPASVFQ